MCEACKARMENAVRLTGAQIECQIRMCSKRCFEDFQNGAPVYEDMFRTYTEARDKDPESSETLVAGLMLLGYAFALRTVCQAAYIKLCSEGGGHGPHS